MHFFIGFILELSQLSLNSNVILLVYWESASYDLVGILAYFLSKEKLRTYTRFSCGQYCINMQSDCIIIHFTRFQSHPPLSVCTPSIDRVHNL